MSIAQFYDVYVYFTRTIIRQPFESFLFQIFCWIKIEKDLCNNNDIHKSIYCYVLRTNPILNKVFVFPPFVSIYHSPLSQFLTRVSPHSFIKLS